MPPKKKVEEEKMVLVGRMGTNLKCGIIGLPNVGKSTFFNVLTKTSIAAAENFPFCTIDPNEARVPVPDARFEWLVEHHKPASKVPAFLNVTDIAGLVKGASEGQGLGNAFLSHIKACDALFHLCRTFEDPDITHVEGDVDPIRDLDIINEELRLKDIEYFDKVFDEVERKYVRGNDKTFKNEYEILSKIKKVLIEDKKTFEIRGLEPSRY